MKSVVQTWFILTAKFYILQNSHIALKLHGEKLTFETKLDAFVVIFSLIFKSYIVVILALTKSHKKSFLVIYFPISKVILLPVGFKLSS